MTQTPTDALRLVPVEPTEAMLKAWTYYRHNASEVTAWKAILAAAPASPLPGGGVEDLIAELKEAVDIFSMIKKDHGIECIPDELIIPRVYAFLARNGKG